MTLTMKKAHIQKQKKEILLFSFMAFVTLFVLCFAVQYHKEIVGAAEFIEEVI